MAIQTWSVENGTGLKTCNAKLKAMENDPLALEKTFHVPSTAVWKAITDKNQLKNWCFEPDDFRAEAGFRFQFTGHSNNGTVYLHHCEVLEAVPTKKLKYSWRYEGFKGISFVTFELTPNGGSTSLRLTHEGLESFPDHPDLQAENFRMGWTELLGQSLKKHLEEHQQAGGRDVLPCP